MTVSLRSIILTVSDLQEAISNKNGSELNRLAHRHQKVRQPIVLWAAALFSVLCENIGCGSSLRCTRY